jgi:glycosyltransferase involved in cell wall biosynthesis
MVATDTGILALGSYTHAVFMNVSARNCDLATRLKRTGVKVLYLYHEPWKTILSYLHTDGVQSLLIGAAAHRVSLPLLKHADVIITGSQYALSVYKQKDARYNQNVCTFPLIYNDEAGRITPKMAGQKLYFSYVGNISYVHGFDQYVDVMRESFLRKSNLRFMIASRSPLPRFVLKDKTISSNFDKIKILCGRTLQNSEINSCYASSFCVWNLYRRSTQSGVLPKAFMFGTPVIASRIGSFPEYIRDKFNGRFARADDRDGVLSVLEEIRGRTGEYAKNCRQSFIDMFFYRSRLEELSQLLT